MPTGLDPVAGRPLGPVGILGEVPTAYFSIPLAIHHFLRRKRGEIHDAWVPMMFAGFILLCGTTHVMEIVTVWNPVYRVARTQELLADASQADRVMRNDRRLMETNDTELFRRAHARTGGRGRSSRRCHGS